MEKSVECSIFGVQCVYTRVQISVSFQCVDAQLNLKGECKDGKIVERSMFSVYRKVQISVSVECVAAKQCSVLVQC